MSELVPARLVYKKTDGSIMEVTHRNVEADMSPGGML